CRSDRLTESREKAISIWVANRVCAPSVSNGIASKGWLRRWIGSFFERFGAVRSAQGIDVALGQNGAQPRRELAATVKITKQRLPARATSAFHAIQLGPERVRQFPGPRFACRTHDRARSRIESRSVISNELLPRRCRAISKRAR